MTRVRYETERGVALLTLVEPPANAYSYEMMQELDQAILRARMDPDVHVLVLTGDGEKFFCAGADVATLRKVTPEYKYYFCLHANETLCRLEQTPKLVIAALNGHCVGGGFEVAMACDLRVAREGGGKLGLPEIALGVLPGTGGTQRLVRLVGRAKALRLMIEGRNMSFAEAVGEGLVDRTIPGDRSAFLAAVLDYARSFAPPERASRAVGRIKRAVVSGAEMSFGDALTLERELQQQLFLGEDAAEGMAAFSEKRKAAFRGR
jgi:enoyl-CoA hydratase/carnithine racemase